LNKSIGVLGCGWLGLPLATFLIEKGYSVKGSTTSKEKMVALQSKGIKPFSIVISEDNIKGNINDFLANLGTIIINIPPKLRGAQKENYVKKIQLLYNQVKQSPIKDVIFVSSTSVYGRLEGPVTEASVPQPTTASGVQLLAAEHIFTADSDLQTTIIRFGGLIGANRHPINMLSGGKERANGNDYINLIHQDDCIGIIAYILTENWWPTLINGVYPYHPKKEKYYTAQAKKRGLPPPKYIENSNKNGKKVIPSVLMNVKEFAFKTSLN